MKDMDLIGDYAASDSEFAFAELVRRHINLVYSVAMRYVRNPEDAEDVAQTVFITLANKAGKLSDKTVIAGWLYETTRFSASKFLRSKIRRQLREQELSMEPNLNDSEIEHAWRQILPLLEDAMSVLNEKERTLLALHYFENKSGAETASILGIEEWAARKRVSRAVEKLRGFFSKRGVILSAGVLMAAISANSVQAAPPGLAATISSVTIEGTAVAGSLATLVNGTIKSIKMVVLKKASITVAIAVVVGCGILELREVSGLRTEVRTLHQQQAPLSHQNAELARECDDARTQLEAFRRENEQLKRDTADLAKVRDELARLKQGRSEFTQLTTYSRPKEC